MVLKDIKPGLKVNIRLMQEVNREANKEGPAANVYISRVFDITDNGLLELDMPTKEGKLLLLPINVRYEFVFISEGGMYKAEGTIRERFKRGNFYLLRAQLLTKLVKFQRREYYRLNCLIPVVFSGVADKAEEFERMSDIYSYLESEPPSVDDTVNATIVDISGGGIRAVAEKKIDGFNYCIIQFSINVRGEQLDLELLAKLIAVQKLEDSKNYSYRFKFLFKDSKLQETLIRFIFEEERRIRKKEQG